MPRTGDYPLGKIYELISDETDDVYIGSTCQRLLSKRLVGHKLDYNCWLKEKGHYRTSCEIVKYDDCQIILLENFPCNDKHELEARERYWIENTPCVNKHIPTRTKHEYVVATKDKKRDYDKERRERLHEEIRKKKIEYYEATREKRTELIICPICHSNIQNQYLKQHQKTKRCQSHINNEENNSNEYIVTPESDGTDFKKLYKK